LNELSLKSALIGLVTIFAVNAVSGCSSETKSIDRRGNKGLPSDEVSQTSGQIPPIVIDDSLQIATWDSHIKPIATSLCLPCHGANSTFLGLADEDAWKTNAGTIIDRVHLANISQASTMPPVGPYQDSMTGDFRHLIVTWLQGSGEITPPKNDSDPDDLTIIDEKEFQIGIEARGLGARQLNILSLSGFDVELADRWFLGMENASTFRFHGNSGYAAKFAFDNTTVETIAPILINTSAEIDVFTLSDSNIFTSGSDFIGRSTTALASNGSIQFNAPGAKVNIPSSLMQGITERPDILGVEKDVMFMRRGTIAGVFIYKGPTLDFSYLGVTLESSLFPAEYPPFAAGTVDDGKSYWFLSKKGLRVLQGIQVGSSMTYVWRAAPFSFLVGTSIKDPSDIAMTVSFDENNLVVVKGPILAEVEQQFYLADKEAGETVTYAWSDIAPLSQQYCVPCHSSGPGRLDLEANWKANSAQIINRVKPASISKSYTMPQIGTPQAIGIQDADRLKMIQWLLN